MQLQGYLFRFGPRKASLIDPSSPLGEDRLIEQASPCRRVGRKERAMQTDVRPALEEPVITPRVHRIEVAVFLLLIIPSMILSSFVLRQGAVPFWLTAVATIFRDVGLVSLILLFAWRNRESWKSFGLTVGRGAWREIGLGVLLFVPMFFAISWLERLLVLWGCRSRRGRTRSPSPRQHRSSSSWEHCSWWWWPSPRSSSSGGI